VVAPIYDRKTLSIIGGGHTLRKRFIQRCSSSSIMTHVLPQCQSQPSTQPLGTNRWGPPGVLSPFAGHIHNYSEMGMAWIRVLDVILCSRTKRHTPTHASPLLLASQFTGHATDQSDAHASPQLAIVSSTRLRPGCLQLSMPAAVQSNHQTHFLPLPSAQQGPMSLLVPDLLKFEP
jgi:hypothetical protein